MRSTLFPLTLAFALIGCGTDISDDFDQEVEDNTPSLPSEFDGLGDFCDEFPELCDTGDTDETEATLQMQFTTAWSAAEHYQIIPGQNDINFGAWMFQSVTGDDITIQDVTMMSYVDSDGDGVFSSLEEEGVNPADYFTNCRMVDVTLRSVIMGPMEFDSHGWVNFTDDFTVSGDDAEAMNFVCDLTEAAEELEFASFAFGIQTIDVISTAQNTQWIAHNVDYVEDGVVPTLAAYVGNACTFEAVTVGNGRIDVTNELTGTLSSTSPSGASIPGYTEVLRVNITSEHDECDDMVVTYLRLEINSTDNAGTDWNDILQFDAYDLSTDPTNPVMTGQAMLDGTMVSLVGDLEIPAGETITFSVWVDTSGASAVSDDALQLELENMLHVDGVSETIYFMDLGVIGGTLQF
ncbi:hypothetical protein HN358_04025 [Candidatus Uhrbacteria bacterium]|jgi:hypothetical protein|nr:hypothetical protein [Candidatus Uhrbacteria bacterium]MBT7716946.1 hypothetical protein [Candidatus Uhrbacteria bacterium]